jgi:hypothetical protein
MPSILLNGILTFKSKRISSGAKKCYFIQVSLGPANEIEPDYIVQALA